MSAAASNADVEANKAGPDERTPLNASEEFKKPAAAPPSAPTSAPLSKPIIAALCISEISLSIALIHFNSWLMQPHRFSHAVPIVMMQMFVSFLMASTLYLVKPSLFPALQKTSTSNDVRWEPLFLPVIALFAMNLILCNMAYAELGVAFIQMIKKSNMVWVCLLAAALGLESFSVAKVLVLAVALLGIWLTIQGETTFVMFGFIVQLLAVLADAFKITFQTILLQGKAIDPSSYVLLVSPGIFVLLSGFCLICMAIPDAHISPALRVPPKAEVLHWTPWLMTSSLLAFLLNLNAAAVIKQIGPVSHLVCCILKDVIAVLVSVTFRHDSVSQLQTVGYAIEMLCVAAWSLLKAYPQSFQWLTPRSSQQRDD